MHIYIYTHTHEKPKETGKHETDKKVINGNYLWGTLLVKLSEK